jgi:hypothetical protein
MVATCRQVMPVSSDAIFPCPIPNTSVIQISCTYFHPEDLVRKSWKKSIALLKHSEFLQIVLSVTEERLTIGVS